MKKVESNERNGSLGFWSKLFALAFENRKQCEIP